MFCQHKTGPPPRLLRLYVGIHVTTTSSSLGLAKRLLDNTTNGWNYVPPTRRTKLISVTLENHLDLELILEDRTLASLFNGGFRLGQLVASCATLTNGLLL